MPEGLNDAEMARLEALSAKKELSDEEMAELSSLEAKGAGSSQEKQGTISDELRGQYLGSGKDTAQSIKEALSPEKTAYEEGLWGAIKEGGAAISRAFGATVGGTVAGLQDAGNMIAGQTSVIPISYEDQSGQIQNPSAEPPSPSKLFRGIAQVGLQATSATPQGAIIQGGFGFNSAAGQQADQEFGSKVNGETIPMSGSKTGMEKLYRAPGEFFGALDEGYAALGGMVVGQPYKLGEKRSEAQEWGSLLGDAFGDDFPEAAVTVKGLMRGRNGGGPGSPSTPSSKSPTLRELNNRIRENLNRDKTVHPTIDRVVGKTLLASGNEIGRVKLSDILKDKDIQASGITKVNSNTIVTYLKNHANPRFQILGVLLEKPFEASESRPSESGKGGLSLKEAPEGSVNLSELRTIHDLSADDISAAWEEIVDSRASVDVSGGINLKGRKGKAVPTQTVGEGPQRYGLGEMATPDETPAISLNLKGKGSKKTQTTGIPEVLRKLSDDQLQAIYEIKTAQEIRTEGTEAREMAKEVLQEVTPPVRKDPVVKVGQKIDPSRLRLPGRKPVETPKPVAEKAPVADIVKPVVEVEARRLSPIESLAADADKLPPGLARDVRKADRMLNEFPAYDDPPEVKKRAWDRIAARQKAASDLAEREGISWDEAYDRLDSQPEVTNVIQTEDGNIVEVSTPEGTLMLPEETVAPVDPVDKFWDLLDKTGLELTPEQIEAITGDPESLDAANANMEATLASKNGRLEDKQSSAEEIAARPQVGSVALRKMGEKNPGSMGDHAVAVSQDVPLKSELEDQETILAGQDRAEDLGDNEQYERFQGRAEVGMGRRGNAGSDRKQAQRMSLVALDYTPEQINQILSPKVSPAGSKVASEIISGKLTPDKGMALLEQSNAQYAERRAVRAQIIAALPDLGVEFDTAAGTKAVQTAMQKLELRKDEFTKLVKAIKERVPGATAADIFHVVHGRDKVPKVLRDTYLSSGGLGGAWDMAKNLLQRWADNKSFAAIEQAIQSELRAAGVESEVLAKYPDILKDQDGRPRIAYHGSARTFYKLALAMLGKNTGADSAKAAFWAVLDAPDQPLTYAQDKNAPITEVFRAGMENVADTTVEQEALRQARANLANYLVSNGFRPETSFTRAEDFAAYPQYSKLRREASAAARALEAAEARPSVSKPMIPSIRRMYVRATNPLVIDMGGIDLQQVISDGGFNDVSEIPAELRGLPARYNPAALKYTSLLDAINKAKAGGHDALILKNFVNANAVNAEPADHVAFWGKNQEVPISTEDLTGVRRSEGKKVATKPSLELKDVGGPGTIELRSGISPGDVDKALRSLFGGLQSAYEKMISKFVRGATTSNAVEADLVRIATEFEESVARAEIRAAELAANSQWDTAALEQIDQVKKAIAPLAGQVNAPEIRDQILPGSDLFSPKAMAKAGVAAAGFGALGGAAGGPVGAIGGAILGLGRRGFVTSLINSESPLLRKLGSAVSQAEGAVHLLRNQDRTIVGAARSLGAEGQNRVARYLEGADVALTDAEALVATLIRTHSNKKFDMNNLSRSGAGKKTISFRDGWVPHIRKDFAGLHADIARGNADYMTMANAYANERKINEPWNPEVHLSLADSLEMAYSTFNRDTIWTPVLDMAEALTGSDKKKGVLPGLTADYIRRELRILSGRDQGLLDRALDIFGDKVTVPTLTQLAETFLKKGPHEARAMGIRGRENVSDIIEAVSASVNYVAKLGMSPMTVAVNTLGTYSTVLPQVDLPTFTQALRDYTRVGQVWEQVGRLGGGVAAIGAGLGVTAATANPVAGMGAAMGAYAATSIAGQTLTNILKSETSPLAQEMARVRDMVLGDPEYLETLYQHRAHFMEKAWQKFTDSKFVLGDFRASERHGLGFAAWAGWLQAKKELGPDAGDMELANRARQIVDKSLIGSTKGRKPFVGKELGAVGRTMVPFIDYSTKYLDMGVDTLANAVQAAASFHRQGLKSEAAKALGRASTAAILGMSVMLAAQQAGIDATKMITAVPNVAMAPAVKAIGASIEAAKDVPGTGPNSPEAFWESYLKVVAYDRMKDLVTAENVSQQRGTFLNQQGEPGSVEATPKERLLRGLGLRSTEAAAKDAENRDWGSLSSNVKNAREQAVKKAARAQKKASDTRDPADQAEANKLIQEAFLGSYEGTPFWADSETSTAAESFEASLKAQLGNLYTTTDEKIYKGAPASVKQKIDLKPK